MLRPTEPPPGLDPFFEVCLLQAHPNRTQMFWAETSCRWALGGTPVSGPRMSSLTAHPASLRARLPEHGSVSPSPRRCDAVWACADGSACTRFRTVFFLHRDAPLQQLRPRCALGSLGSFWKLWCPGCTPTVDQPNLQSLSDPTVQSGGCCPVHRTLQREV